MDLVLRPRPSAHQRAAPRDQPPTRLRRRRRASRPRRGTRPPAAAREPSRRCGRSSRAATSRARPSGWRAPRAAHAARGSARSPRAFAVASIATSSVLTSDCAISSSACRVGRDSPGGAHTAVLGDRDLTEVAMHIHPDAAHRPPPFVDVDNERARGRTRQLRIRALSTPGHSRGRPTTNCGRSAHRTFGLPNDCALHSPRHRDTSRTLRPAPDGEPQRRIFIPLQPSPTTRLTQPQNAHRSPQRAEQRA